ncbi:MAG: hypothetical protein EHM70_19610 [Chloroflexota bacterium]|nr:MAG: hypothetical protein EHM70_19610 [Chloroflexota bacterium]
MAELIKRVGWIGAVALLILIPFSGKALADAEIEGIALEKEINGIHVTLVFPTETLKQGETSLVVRLAGAYDQPISGANVSVQVQPLPDAGEHSDVESSLHAETGVDSHETMEMGEHGDSMEMDEHAAEMETSQHGEATEPDEHSAAVETHGHSESELVALSAGDHSGEYEGDVNFSTPGNWQVSISLSTPEEQNESVDFTVAVAQNGSKWFILGGFLASNLIVISTAAFFKWSSLRRPAAIKE